MRISEEHLSHWYQDGYAIVEDFLTPEELSAAQQTLYRTFPKLAEYVNAPSFYRSTYRGGHMKELPFLGDFLNLVAVHPEIVSFAERALETKKIALEQALIWAKYPGVDDFDMALHMDYRTTMLAYPKKQRPLEDIIFLIYYVDVDEQLGATYVVSKRHIKDELLVPDVRSRTEYAELYRLERPVYVRAGSMLIYNSATLHRGSGITAKDRIRFSHHIVYQRDDAPWMGYCVWANQGLTPELQHFIEGVSPRQRELLGFPPRGHAYWNEDMLLGVAARYPNMDMQPYLAAAKLSREKRKRLCGKLQTLRAPREPSPDANAEFASQSSAQSAKAQTSYYYRGMADYYALATGIPADYWLPRLMSYYGVNLHQ